MGTIIRFTLKEVLCKKIVLIAAILGLIFFILYGAILHFAVKEFAGNPEQSLIRATIYPQIFSMGLYFGSFLVNLLAIFISVASISSEIENGILQAIVPKPIRRTEIVLGKYIGYGIAVEVFGGGVLGILLGLTSYISGYSPSNIVPGTGLFLLQPAVLLTLTLFGSTILSTMTNGITVIMLYMIAVVGGMVEITGAAIKNQVLTNVGIVTSLLLPSDAVYRKMVSELLLGGSTPLNTLTMSPFGTASPPSVLMIIYTLGYTLLLLAAAIYIFSIRDI